MKRSRNAFTLVELLVVMSLIAILATMMIAFFPSVTTSAREARAASLVQGWLNIAKQRALRDGTPTGVRLILNPAAAPKRRVTDCQYIAQPDDFSVGKIYHVPVATITQATASGTAPATTITISTAPAAHGRSVNQFVGISGVNVAGFNGSFLITAVPTSTTFQYVTTASITTAGNTGSVSLLSDVSFDLADLTNGYTGTPALWAVQPNDFLEVNGTGLMHRITTISTSTKVIVSPPLPNTILQTPTSVRAYYRIIRAPRVAGDEILKLPDSTFIDIDTNFNFGNTLQNGNEIDILFGPSGAVITRGVTTDKIHLWVRTPNADFPDDPFRGDPTLISIFVRTGAVGAYQPDPQTAGNPYTFVR